MHQFVKHLGNGRSACVDLVSTVHGLVARKTFTSSTAADLLHMGLFGAPNPYGWNQHAIKTSFYRRRILHKLLRFWFGQELTISNTVAWGYDDEQSAYFIDTEFVDGRKAGLATPFSDSMPGELDCLKLLMRKLDGYLLLSGFTGARWQAGYGQPCAYANFLLVEDHGQQRWTWIDPESGVPAIVASDPAAQFGYYLAEWYKRKRPLFDDIDLDKLESYLVGIQNELWQIFSRDQIDALFEDFYHLRDEEQAWRKPKRLLNNLNYRQSKGDITYEQHEYYHKKLGRWTPQMLKYNLKDAIALAKAKLPGVIRKLAGKLNPLPYLKLLLPSHRKEAARQYLCEGVLKWREQGRFDASTQENATKAALIMSDVGSNPYLADFGAHLTIWPLGKIFSVLMAPLLFMPHFNTREKVLIGALIIWGDSLARFAYTLVRGIADRLSGKRFPWLAFVFSPIKWIGYFAYPLQMIYSARDDHECEFLIYLLCSHMAEKIPIYGGENSGVEYRLNRLARSLIKAPIRLIEIWGFSLATCPILVLLHFTWPMPEVSLTGAILSATLGTYAWLKINEHT